MSRSEPSGATGPARSAPKPLAPTFDVVKHLPAMLNAALLPQHAEYYADIAPTNMHRLALCVMLVVSLALFLRASECTLFCPYLEDIELPEYNIGDIQGPDLNKVCCLNPLSAAGIDGWNARDLSLRSLAVVLAF